MTTQKPIPPLSGGINEIEHTVRGDQCLDARNVWWSDNRLTERPGTTPIAGVLGGKEASFTVSKYVNYGFKESAGVRTEIHAPGTTSVISGDKIYFGFEAVDIEAFDWPLEWPNIVSIGVVTGATDPTIVFEAWDGVRWSPCGFSSPTDNSDPYVYDYLWQIGGISRIVIPQNWTASSENTGSNTYEKYWLRGRILRTAATTSAIGLNISVVQQNTNGIISDMSLPFTIEKTVQGVLCAWLEHVYGDEIAYTTMCYSSALNTYFLDDEFVNAVGDPGYNSIDTASALNAVGSTLYIPEESSVYITFKNVAMKFKVNAGTLAKINREDWAIGSGAPYDETSVALEQSWPSASGITFHQNRIWAWDILGAPNLIRWSAPYPYQDVWPSLAYAYTDEPVVSAATLGDWIVLYSANNIYTSVEASVGPFGVSHYRFDKTPGVGCVAKRSLADFEGGHIFLGLEGIYTFNGEKKAKNILKDKGSGQNRIFKFWKTINKGSISRAIGINWKAKNCYLLAVPVNSSTVNNAVIVWDYLHDAVWIWDDINILEACVSNVNTLEETIFFRDRLGRIIQLDGQFTFDAHPEIYATIKAPGFAEGGRISISELETATQLTSGQVTVNLLENNKASGRSSCTVLAQTPTKNRWGTGKWGAMKWVSDYASVIRKHLGGLGETLKVKISRTGGRFRLFGTRVMAKKRDK